MFFLGLETSTINIIIFYRTQPQPTACQAMKDKRCCWTRGKVLGGSSVLNTMLYIRGNRRDFDQWADFGNSGWSYEEILPYFRKSEDQRNPYLARNKRYHGTGEFSNIQVWSLCVHLKYLVLQKKSQSSKNMLACGCH